MNYLKQTISSPIEDVFITRSQAKLALLDEDKLESSNDEQRIRKPMKKSVLVGKEKSQESNPPNVLIRDPIPKQPILN